MPATRGRAASQPKPKADAYVGLLIISLLAMIAACVLLFLDYNEYPETAKAKSAIQQAGTRPAPQPPAGGGAGGAPPGGMGGAPPGGMMGGAPPGGMGGAPPGGMMGGAPPGAMMGKGGVPK